MPKPDFVSLINFNQSPTEHHCVRLVDSDFTHDTEGIEIFCQHLRQRANPIHIQLKITGIQSQYELAMSKLKGAQSLAPMSLSLELIALEYDETQIWHDAQPPIEGERLAKDLAGFNLLELTVDASKQEISCQTETERYFIVAEILIYNPRLQALKIVINSFGKKGNMPYRHVNWYQRLTQNVFLKTLSLDFLSNTEAEIRERELDLVHLLNSLVNNQHIISFSLSCEQARSPEFNQALLKLIKNNKFLQTLELCFDHDDAPCSVWQDSFDDLQAAFSANKSIKVLAIAMPGLGIAPTRVDVVRHRFWELLKALPLHAITVIVHDNMDHDYLIIDKGMDRFAEVIEANSHVRQWRVKAREESVRSISHEALSPSEFFALSEKFLGIIQNSNNIISFEMLYFSDPVLNYLSEMRRIKFLPNKLLDDQLKQVRKNNNLMHAHAQSNHIQHRTLRAICVEMGQATVRFSSPQGTYRLPAHLSEELGIPTASPTPL